MDNPPIVGSLKKKKSKIKKKRMGSCFGPIVVECAPSRSRAFATLSSPRKDVAGKDQFHRRSLSGVVKAMLFGTSMGKKFRKVKHRGKIDKTENDSNSNPNPKPKSKSQKTTDTPMVQIPPETESSFRKTASSSSLSTSAAGFPSSVSSLKSSSTSSRSKIILTETMGKSRSCDVGLCLVLISLLVLVFWGKICAILCTSCWLFFVPRLNFRFRSSNCVEGSPVEMEVYSKEDKKKVVLEGLLERNRLVRDQ